MSIPAELMYARSHEWARTEGDFVVVGISHYAQDQLGDIVFVELPEVGDTLGQGEEFGTVESVKAVSELYMPVAGEVVAINDTLEDAPEKVNNTPYGDGWMLEVKADNPAEINDLMDNNAYVETLKG